MSDNIKLYTCPDAGGFYGVVVRENPDGSESTLYCGDCLANRAMAHCDAWQWAQLHAYSFEPCEFA